MDTLWIQINLRSFINQMDASSWFMTPFWFKCRFFCNVVGLWRRYKYSEVISCLCITPANCMKCIIASTWAPEHLARWGCPQLGNDPDYPQTATLHRRATGRHRNMNRYRATAKYEQRNRTYILPRKIYFSKKSFYHLLRGLKVQL